MRSSLLRNVRPLLPIIAGLLIGISVSVFRAPVSSKNCIHLKRDHFERHLSSVKEKVLDSSYSDQEIAKLGYIPMKEDEAFRYRKDREYAPPVQDFMEDFEPRIIMDPELKPKVAADYEKNKKIVRPRFLKTELGIRDRLICGVVTSRDSLPTMGVAMNRTFSHHMQNVIFFIGSKDINSLDEEDLLPPPYLNILTLSSNQQSFLLLEILSQLFIKYGETYDWFFLTTDQTYSEAHRINELVDHISINRRLYMGRPVQFQDSTQQITYCDLKNGILLSRLLFLDLFPHLKSCGKDVDFGQISPDKWLGRCIKRATRGAVDCVDNEDGTFYHTFELPPFEYFDPETETADAFRNALTVSGVNSPTQMYQLHKRFSEIEVDLAYKEIVSIQDEIKSLEPKLPADSPKLTWPIGINPPFRPTNRWDIIAWDYFTEDYTLTCPGEIPRCELNGIDKIDISNIIEVALKRLNEKYNPKGLFLQKKKLVNGYRRFDPQRGMEYVLDLLLNIVVDGDSEEIEVNHRVDLLRPLTKAEIVPMPFVTESSLINIILVVKKHQRPLFKVFMENFAKVVLNSEERASLVIVFVYDNESALKLRDDDIYVEEKKLLNEYEIKYKKEKDTNKLIPWISIKTELISQLKVMDIEAKKLPTDALLFITSPAANINFEFLNRCRMNTIKGWQAFFPIPFSQYNPKILYKDSAPPDQIEIKPNFGHFDIYSFDEVCIFNSDYINARALLLESINAHETQISMMEAVDTMDIYDVLIKYSQLHIFRAVEPQLTRRYSHRSCTLKNGEDIYQRCMRSNAEGLASRAQLAMELFPDD